LFLTFSYGRTRIPPFPYTEHASNHLGAWRQVVFSTRKVSLSALGPGSDNPIGVSDAGLNLAMHQKPVDGEYPDETVVRFDWWTDGIGRRLDVR